MDVTIQMIEVVQVFTDRFDVFDRSLLLALSLFLLVFISFRLCFFAWTIVSATFAFFYYVPLDLLPEWAEPAKEFALQLPALMLDKLIERL